MGCVGEYLVQEAQPLPALLELEAWVRRIWDTRSYHCHGIQFAEGAVLEDNTNSVPNQRKSGPSRSVLASSPESRTSAFWFTPSLEDLSLQVLGYILQTRHPSHMERSIAEEDRPKQDLLSSGCMATWEGGEGIGLECFMRPMEYWAHLGSNLFVLPGDYHSLPM